MLRLHTNRCWLPPCQLQAKATELRDQLHAQAGELEELRAAMAGSRPEGNLRSAVVALLGAAASAGSPIDSRALGLAASEREGLRALVASLTAASGEEGSRPGSPPPLATPESERSETSSMVSLVSEGGELVRQVELYFRAASTPGTGAAAQHNPRGHRDEDAVAMRALSAEVAMLRSSLGERLAMLEDARQREQALLAELGELQAQVSRP